MIGEGIVDPTTVTCSALAHAASVAGLVLNSEVIVTASPIKNPSAVEADAKNTDRSSPL